MANRKAGGARTLAIAFGLACLLVVGLSSGCWLSGTGDWELHLSGAARETGVVGYKIDGQLLTVDVDLGETAQEVGPRLAALMRAEGLTVECERCHEGTYYSIVRGTGTPDTRTDVQGIVTGHGGPLQDDRLVIEACVTAYFRALNASSPEGEHFAVESMEEPTVGCYEATICLRVIHTVDGEEERWDTCLDLTRPVPCNSWRIADGLTDD
ncbi:MAG: hypothetical protein SVP26_07765 [Chloroflexota bacterium]|nr:hypothetical protein [Chloroflexota bacterium]